MIVLACAVSLVVGFVLGVAAEWRLLREWVTTALRQAAELHTDYTPTRPFTAAGPDDAEARARIGRRP